MRFIICIVFAFLFSCTEKSEKVKVDQNNSLQLKEIFSLMANCDRWVIKFTSRGGALAGMDSDSSITFYDEGRITMVEFGYAPVYYHGTYIINKDGEISAKFKDYPQDWPSMRMKEVDHKIFLFRSDEQTQLEFGGRGGAVETSDMKPFWPFGLSELSWPEPEPYKESDAIETSMLPILEDLDDL